MAREFFNRNIDTGRALEIARGRISGACPIVGFGINTTSGSANNVILYPGPTFNIPPAAGVQMTIVSTSANDTVGGSGVQQLEVHYLDANLDDQIELVNMNGLTPVLTVASNIRFIQCFHGHLVGATKLAEGLITCSNGGIEYARVSAGRIRCESSARMVPRGKNLFVADLSAGANSGTATAQVEIELVATQLDIHIYTEQGLFIPHGIACLQDNTATLNVTSPGPFREGAIVAMRGRTDKAATMTGTWFGWTELALP
jgi:hypothetical protein